MSHYYRLKGYTMLLCGTGSIGTRIIHKHQNTAFGGTFAGIVEKE